MSDRLGRKPVLLGTQIVMTFGWYFRDASRYTSSSFGFYIVCLCRLLNSPAHITFLSTCKAAFSDLYGKDAGKQAAALASFETAKGWAFLTGPFLLPLVGTSVRDAFVFRSGSSMVLFLWLLFAFRETKRPEEGIKHGHSPIFRIKNPLSFTKLFTRGKTVRMLVLTAGLQCVPEGKNISDLQQIKMMGDTVGRVSVEKCE